MNIVNNITNQDIHLPGDLLEIILLNHDIGITTLSHCRLVCTQLYQFIHQKYIFKRYIQLHPKDEILQSWDQSHPGFSSFLHQIITNHKEEIQPNPGFNPIIYQRLQTEDKTKNIQTKLHFFDQLLFLLDNEKDPLKLQLLQYTLNTSLKLCNNIFINRALLHSYKVLEIQNKISQNSLINDFLSKLIDIHKFLWLGKKPTLSQSLSTLPQERIVTAKESLIDSINTTIQNIQTYNNATQYTCINALILLAYDKNNDIASKAQDTLEKLLHNPQNLNPRYLNKITHFFTIKTALKKALLNHIKLFIVFLFPILSIKLIELSHHHIPNPLPLKNCILSIPAVTSTILIPTAIFQFITLLCKRLEHNISLSLNYFKEPFIQLLLAYALLLTI